MKKTNILVLILVLLLVPMLSLYSCDVGSKMIVGEVKYVDWDIINEPGTDKYYISIESFYILPYGQDENARWEYFIVRKNTEAIYSADATYLDVMPEIAVGNVVEIEYRVPMTNSYLRNPTSIEFADTSKEIPKQENIALKLNKDFLYTDSNTSEKKGTVLRVVKIEAPLSGYLVYFDGTTPYGSGLQCHWVGNVEIGVISEEFFEELEAGEVGYTIKFEEVQNQHPFENYLAEAILNVSIVEE